VLGGLEDYLLLHLLNMSGFFAFVWLPLQVGLSSPTTSRGAVASRFALAGYLLEVACDSFMPKVVTVPAPLLEAGALTQSTASTSSTGEKYTTPSLSPYLPMEPQYGTPGPAKKG